MILDSEPEPTIINYPSKFSVLGAGHGLVVPGQKPQGTQSVGGSRQGIMILIYGDCTKLSASWKSSPHEGTWSCYKKLRRLRTVACCDLTCSDILEGLNEMRDAIKCHEPRTNSGCSGSLQGRLHRKKYMNLKRNHRLTLFCEAWSVRKRGIKGYSRSEKTGAVGMQP